MVIKVIRTLNSNDRQEIVIDDSPNDFKPFARLVVSKMLEEGNVPGKGGVHTVKILAFRFSGKVRDLKPTVEEEIRIAKATKLIAASGLVRSMR
jgi:hypothetical protein